MTETGTETVKVLCDSRMERAGGKNRREFLEEKKSGKILEGNGRE